MIKVVIIKTKKGQKYAEFIKKEIDLAGYSAGITTIVDLKEYLAKNKCSPKETIIHTRTAHPDYTYKILKSLEDEGYRVINSSQAVKLTSDKFNSCQYAEENKIPCAETIKIEKKDGILKIKEKIKEWGDVIVKPITSQGQGEFCFKFNQDNIDELEIIKSIPGKRLVVQKYLEYQRLTRVIVIGYKSLEKAVFYDEPGNGWKCSVCLNPRIKQDKNPSKELLSFAEDIAQKFGSEICFVDIFTNSGEYILNEINTACSLILHEKISQYSISKEIAKYLLSSSK